MDGAVNSGINTFDLARVYGLSERVFGGWLKRRGNMERQFGRR